MQILKIFKDSMLCDRNSHGFVQCLCDEQAYEENFKDVKLSVDGNQFQINKDSYVKRNGQMCTIQIRSLSENTANNLKLSGDTLGSYWVLGSAFLQNYTVIFDT